MFALEGNEKKDLEEIAKEEEENIKKLVDLLKKTEYIRVGGYDWGNKENPGVRVYFNIDEKFKTDYESLRIRILSTIQNGLEASVEVIAQDMLVEKEGNSEKDIKQLWHIEITPFETIKDPYKKELITNKAIKKVVDAVQGYIDKIHKA